MGKLRSGLSRRRFLGRASATICAPALIGLAGSRAYAADYVLKFAHGLQTSHPAHTNLVPAVKKISDDSGGRLQVRIFPNAQLGGDDELISQMRSGAVDMIFSVPVWFTSLLPEGAVSSLPFIFKDYDQCWAAWDGDLGAHITDRMSTIGITMFKTAWDLGFRQITTNVKPIETVADVQGLKIRVPGNPLLIALFKTLGAAPVVIELEETYSALQTHLVDAQENSLPSIQAAKIQEVVKYCSMTNHVWNGIWVMGNATNINKLPADLKKILFDRLNEAGLNQRTEMAQLNKGLTETFEKGGLKFNYPSQDSFKAKLGDAKFYDEWKQKVGNETWAMMEKYVGKVG
jgi:TRAP-type transport system periplasmic protein